MVILTLSTHEKLKLIWIGMPVYKAHQYSLVFIYFFINAYLTQLTLSSVVDGGPVGHARQVVEGVHAGS